MEQFVELCTESTDREQQIRSVQRLLQNGELDPEKSDRDGFYPIHYAAQYGCLEVVDLLLRYCDPHLATTSGARPTALHIACEKNRLDIVQALLQHCQAGAPPKKDKDGNTPLHLACKIGSLETTHQLLGKYPTSSIYEANKKGVTPLGFAVSGNHSSVARHLLRLSTGNPAQKFTDFRHNFPTFKHEQSLDYPVSIFVLGNRGTGKSTLIKSVQKEGFLNRTLGVIINTLGVHHHYGGVVPSDVSSYGYGRVKFYELASSHQSTQEDIFLSLAEPAHSIFLIILSFKDELREMEANLLFWLSFIHHQYRSITIKPRVAVVGSFLFYQKLGAIRLDNRQRLFLVYHRVLRSHSELCSHFHFLGKYSIDCRKCESPGLRQLRHMLARKCHEMRPVGGEINVPSSCYVLFSALHDTRPPTTDIPALNLSDIEYHISQSASESQPHSLLNLLPATVEDFLPLLDILEERKAIVAIKQLDPRDPCIIYDEYKFLLEIDNLMVERFNPVSQTSHFNPAIWGIEHISSCFSTVPLSTDILLIVLNHFKISEALPHGNGTKFLPSILHIIEYPDPLPTWEPDDPNYAFGFAWCIVPQSNQIVPFFMPRFLYFMLCALYTTFDKEDFDKIVLLETSLYYQKRTELEVHITIDSSMVNLHMRCKKGEEVTCLKHRNTFLSVIHQQRKVLQPSLKVNEYIIPKKEIRFPIQKMKHIKAHGRSVIELKNEIVTTTSNESIQGELCFEPFVWCNNLSKEHLQYLLDPTQSNAPVSKEFLQDLLQKTEGKWPIFADLLQVESNAGTSRELGVGESETNSQTEDPQLPQYGQLLEFFSSISLFGSVPQFISALKNPEHYTSMPVQEELRETETVVQVNSVSEDIALVSFIQTLAKNHRNQASHKFTSSGPSPVLSCSIPKTSPEMQSQLSDVMVQPTQLNQREHVSGHHHGMIPTEHVGKGVYKEKQFIYTGKQGQLLWDEYGVELQFPSTLEEVHIEGTVSVMSTDDDNYVFPEESELVSAVYNISADKAFPEPVTVKLQHCIPIDSAKEASLMSFVIANTEQGPPYKFESLSGGRFTQGSSYAEVQLTHFSILTIIRWRLGRPLPFFASVYYFQNGTANFVVTRNLRAHISAVRDFNKSALNSSEFSMIIDRNSPGVELEIPSNSIWEVTSHVNPARINRTVFLDYQPGRAIPQLTMEIKCKTKEQPPENHDNVTVMLRGVHEPTSFYLKCTCKTDMASASTKPTSLPDPQPHAAAEPRVDQLYLLQGRSGRTVKVIQTAAPSWRRLAYSLHLPGAVVDKIEQSSQLQVDIACEKALREWMSTRSRQPVVWATLLQALQDAELNTLATDLEMVLREGTD